MCFGALLPRALSSLRELIRTIFNLARSFDLLGFGFSDNQTELVVSWLLRMADTEYMDRLTMTPLLPVTALELLRRQQQHDQQQHEQEKQHQNQQPWQYVLRPTETALPIDHPPDANRWREERHSALEDNNGNDNGVANDDTVRQSSPLHTTTPNNVWLHPGVTEIAGPAGSGKTQIGLGMVVRCALYHHHHVTSTSTSMSTLEPTAVYMTLGPTAPSSKILSKRLHQMLQSQLSKEQHRTLHSSSSSSSSVLDSLLRSILFRSIPHEDDFVQLLDNPVHTFGLEPSIQLLVLDSIGGLFRLPDHDTDCTDDGDAFVPRRSALLFAFCAKLLRQRPNLVVLILNEVTAMNTIRDVSWTQPANAGGLSPALGLAWANCVKTSLMLGKHPVPNGGSDYSISVTRSPRLPPGVVAKFRVDAAGPYAIE